MNATPTHTLRAAALMLASTCLFALMAVAIRLASETLHTFEVAFFRNLFGLVAALPLLLRHGSDVVRTTEWPRYLVRCLIGILGMFCGFWAIGHLPLAQAVTLSYSSAIFVVIAAVLFLHERVHLRRWSAVVLGFIGVLVIVRPGTDSFTAGSLIAVAAAIFSALVSVQIKQLSRTEPADRIVFMTTMIWVPMSFLPALAVWTWPQGITWLWVTAAGLLGTAAHLLWTRAIRLGDISALTPISFMQLPVVALFGWWLFGEHLDRWTLVGATIIFVANAYIAHREAILARRGATHAPVEAAKPGE